MAWLKWIKSRVDGRKWAYLCWREDGRETSKPLHTTDKVGAAAHLRRAQRKAKGRHALPGKDAGALLDAYLAEMAVRLKPATVELARQQISAWLDSREGAPMHLWERSDLTDYVSGQDWSPRTTQIFLGACKRWIRWAREDMEMTDFPDFVGTFKGPPVKRPKAKPLTEDQEKAILKAALDHKYLGVPVALALYTGLSRADIRALRWDQVDLEAGKLDTSRFKNGQDVRMDLAAPLQAVLRALPAREGRVVPYLPESNSSLSKALHRLCVKAGVPKGGWHRFRHTFASAMVRRGGADQATVGLVLGHVHDSTVTQIYIHPDDRQASEAIRRAFG